MVKILYQGVPGRLNQLKAAFNANDIQIDNKSLSTITPGSAGILTNYDILAFDLVSPFYMHPNYSQKISAFLNEKRGIILITLREESILDHTSPDGTIRKISNHDILHYLLKIAGYDSNEFGFEQNPSYDLTATSHGKSSIIKKYFEGEVFNIHMIIPNEKNLPIQPLALDHEQNTVAFSIKPYTGQIFVVPPKAGNELIELMKYAIPTIGKSQLAMSVVPEWVYNYPIPGLDKINETIAKTTEQIDKLEKQRQSNKKEQEKLVNIRNVLLYGKGDILHDIVLLVLNQMGFKAKKGPKDGHDIEFSNKKNQFVCEVKGRDKSIKKQDIRQLADWKDQTENDREVRIKGIFIANPWRMLPIEDRDTNDEPNFPNSINNLVALKELCLVTTAQIFAMYCQWKENNKSFNLNEIIKEIYSTTHLYSKFTDIKKVVVTGEDSDKTD